MRRFRLCLFAVILMSGISLSVQAQLSKGHFFLSFEDKNVPVENVEQLFGEWFSLPSGTEWRLTSSSTDDLGMGRIEYVQYVDGIEVEHSQILLHTKDGKVCTANGTVMEADNAPAQSRKAECRSVVFKDSTSTDAIGRTLYLVATPNGYRYAYKVLSADGKEWLYYDAETEQKLKAVPTRHNLNKPDGKATTVTGKSLYSGDVPLDVTQTADGKTWLYDQKRGIHTLLAAYIPTWQDMVDAGILYNYFPQGNLPADARQATQQQWTAWFEYINALVQEHKLGSMEKLLTDHTTYLGDGGVNYSAYKMKKLIINKLNVIDGNEGYEPLILPSTMELVFRFGADRPDATRGYIEDVPVEIKELPATLDMDPYLEVIPREGITVDLRCIFMDEAGNPKVMPYIQFPFKPSSSDKGVYTYNTDIVSIQIEYEPYGDPAVDIHWGMARTLDYYKEVFNRNSYDNNGTPVYNLVYLNNEDNQSVYSSKVCNAFALPDIDPKLMMFGMGGYDPNSQKMLMKPVVDLSVMSHEFTHLVTGNTAKLEYQGESGAIDESFSDMMGISVKKYVKGNDVEWYIGTDVMLNATNMRSLSEPKKSGDNEEEANPDTYNGKFWFDTSNTTQEYDYGGVHINLGVGNKWYYLTSDGGDGTNDDSFMYNVKGIGIEKARQIAYRAMTVYATRQTKYADFRKATLQAAKDLYGANGQEVKTVADAWDAVGVLENGVYPSAITNVRRDMQTDDRYYDLQGRPVSQPGKGIYIYKGKKLIKY